jgi:hypothetical protein
MHSSIPVTLATMISIFLMGCNSGGDYKESFFKGEIPATWSYVNNGDVGPVQIMKGGEILPLNIGRSFSQSYVMYGDVHGGQVDFYFLSGTEVKKIVEMRKLKPKKGVKWTSEIIGKVSAEVENFPVEADGKPSYEKNGGKKYYITLDDEDSDIGLIINKQSMGNAQFEEGLKHFFSTADFRTLGHQGIFFPLKTQ